MVKGSCLCQKVKYEYSKEITEVAICHCNQCKKAQGAAFVINAPISTENFTFNEGESFVKEFFSSSNKKRVFCGECGSPIFSQRTDLPEQIRLRLGTVTEGHIPEPQYEIFCESRSSWFKHNPNRPQFTKHKV